jgi:flagellar protein FlaG
MEVKIDAGPPVSLPAAVPTAPATAGKAGPAPRTDGRKFASPPPGDVEIKKAVREALKYDPIPSRELRIEVDGDLKMIVVKVVDKESGEVIRQIPMAESVARAKRIKDQLSKMVREQRGFAVDQEV